MQGHMIAFRAAMTRPGELVQSKPTIVSSLAALYARSGGFGAQKTQ